MTCICNDEEKKEEEEEEDRQDIMCCQRLLSKVLIYRPSGERGDVSNAQANQKS